MRRLTLIAPIVLGLLLNLTACEEYDSLDDAFQDISSSSSGSSLAQPGWLYINPTIGFVTRFPKGWSVALEEGDAKDRKVVFHNEKGAEFILRFKHMPGKKPDDFVEEITRELQRCLPECCLNPTMPKNIVHGNTNEPGRSFNNTIFNAKTRTLIDQHIIVIMHEEWGFALIAQATTHVDNKVWTNAEAHFNSIVDNFSFDLPTPTPVVCPTCTPTPGE
jgi:hypothetical protein